MSNMHSLSSLAGAIWGPGHDSERCYFVAYAAYYDASGNQDHPSEPLVVVGLESSEALWSRFDAEWSEMLREFDVGHLHMKEFTSFRGEFKDWRNREPDRRQLMQKATRVLSRAVVRAFSVGIHMDEFHKVNAEYVLAEPFGNNAKDAGAYSLAGSTCAALVVVWHYAHRPEHNINHLFEKGDKGQRGLASLIDVSNLGLSDGFSIIPKKNLMEVGCAHSKVPTFWHTNIVSITWETNGFHWIYYMTASTLTHVSSTTLPYALCVRTTLSSFHVDDMLLLHPENPPSKLCEPLQRRTVVIRRLLVAGVRVGGTGRWLLLVHV